MIELPIAGFVFLIFMVALIFFIVGAEVMVSKYEPYIDKIESYQKSISGVTGKTTTITYAGKDGQYPVFGPVAYWEHKEQDEK